MLHPPPQAEVNTVTQCADDDDVGVRGLGAGFPPKHSFPEGNTASARQAAHAEAVHGEPAPARRPRRQPCGGERCWEPSRARPPGSEKPHVLPGTGLRLQPEVLVAQRPR